MTGDRRWGWILAAATLACAPAARGQQVTADSGGLPPAGLGRLTQDQVSITLQQGDLQIRFLPLDERTLRLLAPDGYASMQTILRSRAASVDSAAQASGISTPGLVLVTFFAQRANVSYQPLDLYVTVRNQIYRPVAVIPYSSGFTNQQLQTRGQATAIYLFELPLPVFDDFQVGYQSTTSDAWNNALPTIQRERDRVLGRWRQQRSDSTRR
jgi:hypothetical protein